jgi:hypothetical protein|tara:strand:- start:10268 stop:10576 length:309 start_codon:yes stop_codon:yes gene_type:complete
MIIYNITASVDKSILREWLHWMQNKHIPDVMKTNIFTSAQLKRIISRADDGVSYAIAYKCDSLQDLQIYETKFSKVLQKDYIDKFGETAPAFRTIMAVENTF